MKSKYKYFLSKNTAIRFHGHTGFWQGWKWKTGTKTMLPLKYFVDSPNWRQVKRNEYLFFMRRHLQPCPPDCETCKAIKAESDKHASQVTVHDYYGDY